MPVALDLEDIQGLVARGYRGLRSACFLLLGVDEPSAARGFLTRTSTKLTTARSSPDDSAVNIAFTWEGLRRLGLPETALAGFPSEFVSGITAPHRSRFLGDVDGGAPAHWLWGGPSTPGVDALLLVYGRDEAALRRRLDELGTDMTGLFEVTRLPATDLPTDQQAFREPFGFRDGISQPLIEGLPATGSGAGVVRAGEFVLGYPNEYGLLTERPLLPAQADPHRMLPVDPGGSGRADFGRNGSYLALRQLRQDVGGFWRYVEDATRRPDGSSDRDRSVALAAKLVGRWPSGAPLVLSPERDEPQFAAANDFGYYARDPRGLACPLGAHVRRANPRDTLNPQPGSADSLAVNKRHRILRRSRAYGPVDDSRPEQNVDRGLYFICLNANLTRQFEFVQHTWLNNPNFNGLYDDADPLVGARRPDGTTFTQPARPVRRRFLGVPEFVTVRAGGYFFLPGRQALRYLAGGPA